MSRYSVSTHPGMGGPAINSESAEEESEALMMSYRLLAANGLRGPYTWERQNSRSIVVAGKGFRVIAWIKKLD